MRHLILLLLTVVFATEKDTSYWPQWRGPDNTGMAQGDAPTHWSDRENVKWKTEIPGRGHSSPVIWEDRIFLTTAIPTQPKPDNPESGPQPAPTSESVPQRPRRGGFGSGDAGPQAEHRFEVFCVDRKTGKIAWQRTTKIATPHEGYHRTYGSFASNSPVTDGKHVYAFFGSRGIYCYDLQGKLVWEKDFGVAMRIRLGFGEGTAPFLHGDRLILNFDHEGDSFILALDKNSGKELWRTARDEMSNWSMPLVVEHAGRKQVVVSATRKVRSYDLETGKLIWECAGLGSNTIPAPVQQGDLVFVMSGFRNPNLMAIRLGREGDLTGSDAIVWSNTRGNSYTPSPLLHDNKLYVLTDNGFISCFNASTGLPFYQQVRLPKPYSFKASPVAAGGKIYLASENGEVVVLKMGEKYEVLAVNTLKDQIFISTPAIVSHEIYLRSQTSLYCISSSR